MAKIIKLLAWFTLLLFVFSQSGKAAPKRTSLDATLLSTCSQCYNTPDRRTVREVRDLLERGAIPNCRTRRGWTPLMLAVDDAQQSRIPTPAIRTIRTLLAFGADVNLRDDEGETALMKLYQDPELFDDNREEAECAQLLLGARGRMSTSGTSMGKRPLSWGPAHTTGVATAWATGVEAVRAQRRCS
jgi:hypothetical protein